MHPCVLSCLWVNGCTVTFVLYNVIHVTFHTGGACWPWRYPNLETLSASLALCWGNPRGHPPQKRPVMCSFRVVRLSKESGRRWFQTSCGQSNPDSKVHGANMGPIWGRQPQGGPHVGPMNFVIWGYVCVYLVHIPWYLQPAWWHSLFSAQKGPIQINSTRYIMSQNQVNIVSSNGFPNHCLKECRLIYLHLDIQEKNLSHIWNSVRSLYLAATFSTEITKKKYDHSSPV